MIFSKSYILIDEFPVTKIVLFLNLLSRISKHAEDASSI